MNIRIYQTKALQAISSARLLLEAGDADGTANRAYYAMYNAACAALIATAGATEERLPKTHRGLIAMFGKQLVIDNGFPAELGAALNKVERIRLVADYVGDPISHEDAKWAVEEAERFCTSVSERLVENTTTEAGHASS